MGPAMIRVLGETESFLPEFSINIVMCRGDL